MRFLPLAPIAILAIACELPEPARSPFDYLSYAPSGRFLQVSSYDTTGGNRDRLEIAAGDSAVLVDVVGPGIIQRIWITVSSSDPHYLRRIALNMYWDDEDEPSVSVPLGDFFGNGFDKRHYVSLLMGVSSGGFYSYLPMPFLRHARILVENGTGREIDALYYHVGFVQVDELPSDVPTFHAWWHRDARTESTNPHRVLEAHGAGRFIGLSLNAESYRDNLEFLEGDEFYHVDGEFRGHGTGTEDYFNGGWYFEAGAFDAPTHGVVIKDEERGRVAAYRWHLLDPVEFEDSVRIELEHGHANSEVADYATVAYWYQTEPHAHLPPLPEPIDRRALDVKIPPAAILAEDLSPLPRGSSSVFVVPAPRADRYEVLVYPLGAPNMGAASYSVHGRSRVRVDLEAAEPNTVLEPVSLGVTAVLDSVELEISPIGSQRLAAVELQPIREWATEWNVVGPFPNPRVLATELSPAVDSIYGPEEDPYLSAVYSVASGDQVGWHRATASADGQIRLNAHFSPNDWVAAYAQAFLYSPRDGEATLLFSADDAHVLWVNGNRVSERQGRHVSRADELQLRVSLSRGWNRILVKVADLDGGWAFQMRVADPAGEYQWTADDQVVR
jgi:hypothetical protein